MDLTERMVRRPRNMGVKHWQIVAPDEAEGALCRDNVYEGGDQYDDLLPGQRKSNAGEDGSGDWGHAFLGIRRDHPPVGERTNTKNFPLC